VSAVGHRWKLVVGLIVGPLVIIPLTFSGYAALNLLRIDGFRGNAPGVFRAAGNFALAALIVAYVIQAAFGVAITLLLARSGRFTLDRMLVIGALCGALPFVIAYSIPLGAHRETSTFAFAGVGAVFGSAIAATTYAIGRDGRRAG
jgi:hypothetical protein